MYKVFEYITEVIGWLKIVASPLFGGVAIGIIIYACMPGVTGLIIGISIATIGLIIGIIWATRVWKKTGTTWFLSRVMATPELDPKEEEENSDKKEIN